MRPVISIQLESPEPREWYFSAQLGDDVVGNSQGYALPTATAAMVAGLQAVKAAMTAHIGDTPPISESLSGSESLPARPGEFDHG
jgi:hypothetical protein